MLVRPLPTNFTTLDLYAWHGEGTLELSPKFQRRGVWKPAAKGFFIDTLLSGFPVPPLHIRMSPVSHLSRPRREVIDGQQRLRTLFDFIEGRLRISRSLSSPWAGKTVEDLLPDDRTRITQTHFHVYQYDAIDDATVLEIFARLNTYSVALTAQELRNGRYFGEFKTLVYFLARQYLDFWRDARVFGEPAIARMAEAELVSELLVLQFDGLQDKKRSLDWFYGGLDESWPNELAAIPIRRGRTVSPKAWLSKDQSLERFTRTMDIIISELTDLIRTGPFRRPPIFYTLYALVYDMLFGLPGKSDPHATRPISKSSIASLRSALEEFNAALNVDPNDRAVPVWQRNLAVASARQTDNIVPRDFRFDTLRKLTASA